MRCLNATVAAPDGAWTAEWLGYARTLRPEDVLASDFGTSRPYSRREWAWIQTAQRLAECYGSKEALARLNGYGRQG